MEINKNVLDNLIKNVYTVLAVHIPSSKIRKILHQYIQINYRTLGHYSIYDEKAGKAEKGVIIFRSCCSSKKRVTVLMNCRYSFGTMDNNKDEVYYGECIECGKTHCWECNFDYGRLFYRHNVMLIGCMVPSKNRTIEYPFYELFSYHSDKAIYLNNVKDNNLVYIKKRYFAS